MKKSTTQEFNIPDPTAANVAGSGTKAQIVAWFNDNPGSGITTEMATEILYGNKDLDVGGLKSRKAIRGAQAVLNLQGLKSLRFRNGLQKLYFSVPEGQVKALTTAVIAKGYTVAE